MTATIINAIPLQAIATKYVGPTNSRGARIIATAGNGQKLSVGYDYSGDECHKRVAMQLAEKLGWDGEWAMGSMVATGWVFVNVKRA